MCALNASAETVQMIEGLPPADRVPDRLGAGKALVTGERINQLPEKRLKSVNFNIKGKITLAYDNTITLFPCISPAITAVFV